MSGFENSHVGQLRKLVGTRKLLLPGTRLIVEDNAGNLLLQLRKDFRVWGLIGGMADPGENLDQAIRREAFEEAGITPIDPVVFGFGSNPDLETVIYPNGDVAQHFVMNYVCTRFEGEPVVNDDESLDIKWFSPSDLPEMPPNMLESIHALERFRTTGQFQMF